MKFVFTSGVLQLVFCCACGLFQSKGGSLMPNTPFQPKKEIVFPPDSVEAVQPTLTKRRRLTHKDLGRLGVLAHGIFLMAVNFLCAGTIMAASNAVILLALCSHLCVC